MSIFNLYTYIVLYIYECERLSVRSLGHDKVGMCLSFFLPLKTIMILSKIYNTNIKKLKQNNYNFDFLNFKHSFYFEIYVNMLVVKFVYVMKVVGLQRYNLQQKS